MGKADKEKSEPSNKKIVNENEVESLNVSDGLNIVIDLNKNNLIQGFIMSEILDRPRALKTRGKLIWNSRF